MILIPFIFATESMEWAIGIGKTIVFAMATGSGKISYMKTLVEYIPISCRLIAIKGTIKMKLYKHQNYMHLFYPAEVPSRDNY